MFLSHIFPSVTDFPAITGAGLAQACQVSAQKGRLENRRQDNGCLSGHHQVSKNLPAVQAKTMRAAINAGKDWRIDNCRSDT